MKDLRGLIPTYEEVCNDCSMRHFAFEVISKEIVEDTCRNIGDADWITYFDEIAESTGYPVEFIDENKETIESYIYEYTDNVEIDKDCFSVVAYGNAREFENRIKYAYECLIGDYSLAAGNAVDVLFETIDENGIRKEDEEFTVEMFVEAVNIIHRKNEKLYNEHVDEFRKIGACFYEFPDERIYKDGELKTTKKSKAFYICGYCGCAFLEEDTDPEVFEYEDKDWNHFCSNECIGGSQVGEEWRWERY